MSLREMCKSKDQLEERSRGKERGKYFSVIFFSLFHSFAPVFVCCAHHWCDLFFIFSTSFLKDYFQYFPLIAIIKFDFISCYLKSPFCPFSFSSFLFLFAFFSSLFFFVGVLSASNTYRDGIRDGIQGPGSVLDKIKHREKENEHSREAERERERDVSSSHSHSHFHPVNPVSLTGLPSLAGCSSFGERVIFLRSNLQTLTAKVEVTSLSIWYLIHPIK